MNLAGFSLGGNFFLRVAARARDAGIELERVVAVCPVLDPEHTLVRLESGWALYRQVLRLEVAAFADEEAGRRGRSSTTSARCRRSTTSPT